MKGINKKLTNVINFPAPERYSYFIRKAADFEEVWGLYDNGWALLESKGNRILAFWPECEFAELCAIDTWQSYTPKKITLEDFTDKWLEGMRKDGTEAAIFYTPEEKGIVVSAQQLLDDLSKELAQYE
jgi:Protein of unknown function (DUF2750)